MSAFSADWLALRAAADARARDRQLEAELVAALAPRVASASRGTPAAAESPLVCVDLACGTGANVRRLAPRLPGVQHWRLVDADPALLERALAECGGLRAADGRAISVECRALDLASSPLEPVLTGAAVVTAAALLDLVSGAWLERLADAVVATGAVGLFALDYDGRRACIPHDPLDARAHAAFDRHQRTDKSFGAALGPEAAGFAARTFAARGCRVRRARSDWVLGVDDHDLQRELLRGWAEAASAIDPDGSAEYADWLRRRLAHVAVGASELRVGHEDLLVAPPGGQITRTSGGSVSSPSAG